MTVADSFKRFRQENGLTQQQVADAISVHKQAYQRYEYGRLPSADVIIRIADAFNVSTDYLLGRTDVPEVYHHYKTNAETMAAIEEIERGEGLSKPYDTVEELMEALNAED